MNVTNSRELRPQLGRNLTHGLLDVLGRAIVTGGYGQQSFPTEAELAKQHGVSRSVTREAVKMLTAKGLLSSRPKQGTIVQPTTSWNLFDTDVLRWLLERTFSVDLLRHFNQLRVAIEPEPIAEVKMFAPRDFRKQLQRAITPDDYARLAEQTGADKIQRAAGHLRWAGSWYEMRTAIDASGVAQTCFMQISVTDAPANTGDPVSRKYATAPIA